MYGDQFGAAVIGVAERDGDRHLAAHCWICGFELVDLDHALVRHELYEAAVVGVGVCACFAGSGLCVVGERDSEPAPFAGFQGVDVGGHAGWHLPLGDCVRVDQRGIDLRPRSLDTASDAGGVHPVIVTPVRELSPSSVAAKPGLALRWARGASERSLKPDRRRGVWAAGECHCQAATDRAWSMSVPALQAYGSAGAIRV